MNELPPLVVVLGPTASGKSALGIALAKQLGGEVVVCDSTQVYRHFDIGTAKVSSAEQVGIRHHLVDLVEPAEVFTAGDYRRCALAVLDDLKRRSKVPVLTAGTGLYLRALLEGLADAPTRSDALRERLRARVNLRGAEYLHKMLRRLDPQAASKVAGRDLQKIIRALEIRLLSGKSVDAIHGEGREPLRGYRVIKIGLLPPRPALYKKIHDRIDAMLKAGWLDEVRRLIAMGIPVDAKPFQFIGYSELCAHVEGKITLNAAVEQIQKATRNFAKRQITWFRKEPHVAWIAEFGHTPETLNLALPLLQP
jgi:tRNA dimethylallyltransferase